MLFLNEPIYAWAAIGWAVVAIAGYGISLRARQAQRRRWQWAQPVAGAEHIQFSLHALSIGFLLLALAGPATKEKQPQVSTQAADLVVALDLSRSMLASDLAPDRLSIAKDILLRLIKNPPQQLRLGLVVFAGAAYVQLPLTTDMATAQLQVQSAQPQNIGIQGTAIAAALQRASAMLNNEQIRGKNVWLFTDGENHEPGMDESIAALTKMGCTVTSVGFGSAEGAAVKNSYDGSVQTNEDGSPIVTKPNAELLTRLAAATGGQYISGNDPDAAWARLSTLLKNAQTRGAADAGGTEKSWAFVPLILAVLMMLTALIMKTANGRKPLAAALWLCFVSLGSHAQSPATPGAMDAYKQLQAGHAALKMKNYAAAAAAYEQAARHPQFLPIASYHKALLAQQQQQYGPAADLWKPLMKDGHKQLSAYAAYNYGWAMGQQKKWNEAAEGFKQALRLQPADAEARENLQYVIHQMKQQKPPPSKGNEPKQKPPPGGGGLSQQRADQLLDQLRQREEQLQKQLQKKGQRQSSQGKDW